MPRIEAVRGPSGRYLPQVTVDVVIRKQKQPVSALVDSGADRTIVPKGLVEALGLDYSKLPESKDEDGNPVRGMGAGGAFPMRDCRGKVRWRMWTVCEVFWVGPDEAVPWVLLGRDDFFRMFDVRFVWSAKPPIMEIDLAAS